MSFRNHHIKKKQKRNYSKERFVSLKTIVKYFKVQLKSTRCDLNLTQCENYDTVTHPNICEIMNKYIKVYTDLADRMKPNPKCPLDMPSIKILNATVDLSFAARLPLDGFTWITSIKLYKSIAHVRHKKQLLFCLISQNTITKSRR